jgi:voltage-gated sodium channel
MKKSLRTQCLQLVNSPRFQNFIMLFIVLNGIVLGLETSPSVMAHAGDWLHILDKLFLAIFIVELTLAIIAMGGSFFKSPWRVFDFFVIAIALLPTLGPLSILRAFRVLRVFRLLTVSPQLRSIVSALLSAIPGMSSIIGLLMILFYVFGVMSTKLFGASFPDWFGTLGRSMYTLFQVMTLESWSMGIVRPIMENHPYAWIFFVPFICIATFTMLNLFIAVIVNAMQNYALSNQKEEIAAIEQHTDEAMRPLQDELKQLRDEIKALRQELKRS